tara:strand:+ start:537 stop:812 length:276 start_codon:yes stop_codon:yes gene_type:complete
MPVALFMCLDRTGMPNALKRIKSLSSKEYAFIININDIEINVANNKGSSKLRANCDQLGYILSDTIIVANTSVIPVKIVIINLASFMLFII